MGLNYKENHYRRRIKQELLTIMQSNSNQNGTLNGQPYAVISTLKLLFFFSVG